MGIGDGGGGGKLGGSRNLANKLDRLSPSYRLNLEEIHSVCILQLLVHRIN